jgi:signal transduction histidine kinase
MELYREPIALVPFVGSLVISLGIGAYAWQQRSVKGVRGYAIYVFSQATWTFGYILELISPTLESKQFWDDFQYVGYFGVVHGSILFALLYTDLWNAQHRRRRLWLAGFFWLLTLITLTNRWHGLVAINYRLIPYSPFDVLLYDFQPLGYAIVFSIYFGAIILITFLARFALKLKPFYRLQIALVAIGFLIPTVVSFGAFFNITYVGQRDITPLSFGLANIIIAWGLFRYHLFDLRPIAQAVVLENLKAGVFVFDADNRLVDWNPAARWYFNPNIVKLGDDILTVFRPWPDIAQQYANETNIIAEITHNHITVDLQISPLLNNNNERVGKLVMIYDITERVIIREQLRQRTIELEHVNTELVFARNKAEEADRLKSQFVSTMSHELRTPLSAMMLFTELVLSERHGLLTPKQKDSLTKSMSSGRHLLSLINDVLDITKIEAGMMSFIFEDEVDLRPDIEAVESTALTLLQNKSVAWRCQVPDILPRIRCDRRRILQVLLNLVSNACKFTNSGEVALVVSVHEKTLLFAVSDTGVGISKSDYETIFQPFKQTPEGIKQAVGTGLGLSICKSLVEAHHGKIWLESEMGVGSTFFVELPFTFDWSESSP